VYSDVQPDTYGNFYTDAYTTDHNANSFAANSYTPAKSNVYTNPALCCSSPASSRGSGGILRQWFSD